MEQEAIVQEAVEQFRQNTGIEATWKEKELPGIDGVIIINNNKQKHIIFFEAKKQLREHQLYDLLKLRKEHYPLMVIAEHIFPKIKEQLRQEDIGYLETNGNIYLKHKDLLFWIDGLKPKPRLAEKAGRAFTKTGLKVVFHFLLHEDWVNLTYREIAQRTGTPFGNINFVMTDLKEKNFLVPVDKDNYKLVKKEELLNQWMVAYKEKLKPALLIGKFRFLDEKAMTAWKKLPLQNQKTWWGAEPAANLLTGYLQPEVLTLYTTETKPVLMKDYRLIPDDKGPVQVYQKFWKQDNEKINTIPPLLVYVDLLNNGDRRSHETAQKIKNEFLQDKF